jgi:hypothetical protein
MIIKIATVVGLITLIAIVFGVIVLLCEMVEAAHEAIDLTFWRIENAKLRGLWDRWRKSPRFWLTLPKQLFITWLELLGTSPGWTKYNSDFGWWVGTGNWILQDPETATYRKGPNYNRDVPVLRP